MTPYYQDKFITIYNEDVIGAISQLPSDNFDLIFADPPFNVGKDYGKDKDRRGNYYEWCKSWIDLGFKALNPKGTFSLMTISRHLPQIYPLMHGIFISQVCWRNVSAVANKRQFWPSYQPILFYGKTEEYYFNTYAQTTIDRDKSRWGEYSTEQKGQLTDYWNDIPFIYAGSIKHPEAFIKEDTNSKIHPAQMPEDLAERILSFSCPPSGKIVELFMGTGSTLRVAKNLGMIAIGIDINESYCELAAKRCEHDGQVRTLWQLT